MCGIAGEWRASGGDQALVAAMVDRLRHRGPVEDGYFHGGPVAFGMARLSIIDIDGGHQPVFNEDRSIVCVFNGQIYNYVELMKELETKGHRFTSRSDTEVLVHLYEEEGDDFLTRLNGMFAIALWDGRRNRLLLARDRLGVKPLYLAEVNGRTVFASELKSLLLVPGLDRTINPQAIADYLTFMYIRAPNTPFRAVQKLRPGHCLVIDASGKRHENAWWRLADAVRTRPTRPAKDVAEEIRDLIDDAVRIRLRSDVPVGAFLSGGLDSSAVTAIMAHHANAPPHTYSVGFGGDHLFDETPYAREVSTRFGTVHHELTVQASDALEKLPELVWFLDEPHGDTAVVPSFLVSQFAARDLRVVLSGVGGDELFGGYSRYFDGRPMEHLYRHLPLTLRRAAVPVLGLASDTLRWRGQTATHSQPGRFLRQSAVFDPEHARHLSSSLLAPDLGQEFEAARVTGADEVNQLMLLDLQTYLPDDVLHITDRMSMAVSLEVREPLLDHRLIEAFAALPSPMKLNQKRRDTKICFKAAMRGLVPDSVLNRPKLGFGAPVDHWMANGMAETVRDLYQNSSAVAHGVLNGAAVANYLASGASYDGVRRGIRLWTLLTAELWSRIFLDGDGARPDFHLELPRKCPSGHAGSASPSSTGV